MEEIINFLNSKRREYAGQELNKSSVNKNPITQLALWMEDAVNAQVPDPSAMTLSTTDQQGKPSSRIVLLRGAIEDGLVFYTNYNSKKGSQLASNPNVAVNFFWVELHRQIRIEGVVEKVDAAISDAYFASRPRESQLAAHASEQSSVLRNRDELEAIFTSLKEKYAESPVPRPEDWGGYRIVPNYFEFWQGRPNRMHDRIAYTKIETSWKIDRLAP